MFQGQKSYCLENERTLLVYSILSQPNKRPFKWSDLSIPENTKVLPSLQGKPRIDLVRGLARGLSKETVEQI